MKALYVRRRRFRRSVRAEGRLRRDRDDGGGVHLLPAPSRRHHAARLGARQTERRRGDVLWSVTSQTRSISRISGVFHGRDAPQCEKSNTARGFTGTGRALASQTFGALAVACAAVVNLARRRRRAFRSHRFPCVKGCILSAQSRTRPTPKIAQSSGCEAVGHGFDSRSGRASSTPLFLFALQGSRSQPQLSRV